MSFQWPLALVALLVVPLVAALYVARERRRTQDAARWGNPALLPNLVDASPGRRRHLPLALLLVALTAMVVGVARPHATVSVKREEATVVLAVDTSLSMRANDVKPSRLAAARAGATRFLEQVPERFRVGVVGFTGRAYVALPPTQDRSLAERALASLHTGEGTALGDAVSLAVRVGKRERTSDGVVPPAAVLVISDGAQKSGRTSPDVAARRARAAHVPVYAILLGTQNGVVDVPLKGGYHVQLQVPPQGDTLKKLTRSTGGRLFTATDEKGLRDVYRRLGSRLGHRRQPREVTDLFAAGSAALLLVGGALSAVWFRRMP